MGRIKSIPVKNLGREIIAEHGDRLSTDFDKNKKIVNEVKKIDSKKIRNTVAGYITKEMEKAKKSGV